MTEQNLLGPLLHILKIPSVSTQDKHLPEMKKARDYLVNLFQSIGFKTKILKGKRHDAVFAELTTNNRPAGRHGRQPTTLIYGHYDVQPPDPMGEWKTPPFEPTIKQGKIYGRGTTDQKGQLMIHIMAVKKLLKSRPRGVNFKFIIEGEEEIGSVSVEEIVKKYKDLLKADYLVVSDSQMPEEDQPSIDVSLRGLLYTEVKIQTAKHDLHSGQFGGAAENPANLLAHIIAKLKDENGKILIPNFYKNVMKPTKEELKAYKSSGLTTSKVKKEGGLYLIGGGESELNMVDRMWTRPTLDINGIWSGYTNEGAKTIIPAKASAKISMRLVPNQNPGKIFTNFEEYIKKLTPEGAKITIKRHADCLPYKAPTDDPVFSLIKQSLKKAFGKYPVFTAVGGSVGFVPIVARELNIPCILVGFGLPTDNLHAPNEHFSLSNYYKGIETMEDFYLNLDKIEVS